jgi:hypothetical protein
MKTPLLIILTAVVVVGALAIMNSAYESGHHNWCAGMSGSQRHARTGHG